jgi:hypothetical protein
MQKLSRMDTLLFGASLKIPDGEQLQSVKAVISSFRAMSIFSDITGIM